MGKTQKLTLTAMMVAIGTLSSHVFYIPMGFAKVFPLQHFINVLSAVLLGPYYAVAQAFTISLLRNMMGTGSIFAFPGSMLGALIAAILFSTTRKVIFAGAGEVIGTGILGAIASYPIATLLLGKQATLFGFIPAFIFSSLSGAVLAYVLLAVFFKNAGVRSVLNENSTYNRRF